MWWCGARRDLRFFCSVGRRPPGCCLLRDAARKREEEMLPILRAATRVRAEAAGNRFSAIRAQWDTDGDGRMAYHVTDVLFSRADGRMVIPPLLVHSASGTEDPKLTNDHTAHIFDEHGKSADLGGRRSTEKQRAGTERRARWAPAHQKEGGGARRPRGGCEGGRGGPRSEAPRREWLSDEGHHRARPRQDRRFHRQSTTPRDRRHALPQRRSPAPAARRRAGRRAERQQGVSDGRKVLGV